MDGQLHLEIEKNVQPVQLPTRRVPTALKELLKKELDWLPSIGVIQKVDIPNERISAIVVTIKKNCKVRLNRYCAKATESSSSQKPLSPAHNR